MRVRGLWEIREQINKLLDLLEMVTKTKTIGFDDVCIIR